MGTSKEEIRKWLVDGQKLGATHVLIVVDTFDYEDYPVYVMPNEDVRAKEKEYSKDMQKVMEVYALHLDLETQLSEFRVFSYDTAPTGVEPETVPVLPEVPTLPPRPKKVRVRKVKGSVAIVEVLQARLAQAATRTETYRTEADVLRDVLNDIYKRFPATRSEQHAGA